MKEGDINYVEFEEELLKDEIQSDISELLRESHDGGSEEGSVSTNYSRNSAIMNPSSHFGGRNISLLRPSVANTNHHVDMIDMLSNPTKSRGLEPIIEDSRSLRKTIDRNGSPTNAESIEKRFTLLGSRNPSMDLLKTEKSLPDPNFRDETNGLSIEIPVEIDPEDKDDSSDSKLNKMPSSSLVDRLFGPSRNTSARSLRSASSASSPRSSASSFNRLANLMESTLWKRKSWTPSSSFHVPVHLPENAIDEAESSDTARDNEKDNMNQSKDPMIPIAVNNYQDRESTLKAAMVSTELLKAETLEVDGVEALTSSISTHADSKGNKHAEITSSISIELSDAIESSQAANHSTFSANQRPSDKDLAYDPSSDGNESVASSDASSTLDYRRNSLSRRIYSSDEKTNDALADQLTFIRLNHDANYAVEASDDDVQDTDESDNDQSDSSSDDAMDDDNEDEESLVTSNEKSIDRNLYDVYPFDESEDMRWETQKRNLLH